MKQTEQRELLTFRQLKTLATIDLNQQYKEQLRAKNLPTATKLFSVTNGEAFRWARLQGYRQIRKQENYKRTFYYYLEDEKNIDNN